MSEFRNGFVYGTQYYRAPTPTPDEWEQDLRRMGEAGLDTIQIRIQWRKNEPRENDYEFDDIDRLFELAEKHEKKVIFKFLMENAPDYIYEKYSGHRKGLNGTHLGPGANGAFYIGGWMPCFDNPDVVKRAEAFTKIMVERYRGQTSLLLWNIWNEPRSRPIGECCCPHSLNAYRVWLRKKFGKISELNQTFGKGWESFDTVTPPSMSQDYAELFLWRQWSLDAVAERLRFMYDTIKSLDDSRPIISHVGACSAVQDVASDGSDDFVNSRIVDFYGTSLPTAPHFRGIVDETQPLLICDWLRGISSYYWVYELYPDWGEWNGRISKEDFLFKVCLSLACGAKGLLYWQYRAERLGCENDLGGLVNIDGSFREISFVSADIKKFILENEAFLCHARVVHDGVGILYSRDSDLINRIENTGRGLFNFDLRCNGNYLYNKSIQGIYALYRELGYTCELIDSRMLTEKLGELKTLYIPEAFILSEDEIRLIREFAEHGGQVIAEEGIGLRHENTWLDYPWPGNGWNNFFGVEVTDRTHHDKAASDTIAFGDADGIPAGEFISRIRCRDAKPVAEWASGGAAVTRKGNRVYIGTSLGEAFFNHCEVERQSFKELLRTLTAASLGMEILPERVYVRRLKHEKTIMNFIFNRNKEPQTVRLNGQDMNLMPGETRILTECVSENKIDNTERTCKIWHRPMSRADVKNQEVCHELS